MKDFETSAFEYYLARFGPLIIFLVWIVFSGELDVAMYLVPIVIGGSAILLSRRVRFRRRVFERETNNMDKGKWSGEQWSYFRETQILQQMVIPLTWLAFAVFVVIAIVKTV